MLFQKIIKNLNIIMKKTTEHLFCSLLNFNVLMELAMRIALFTSQPCGCTTYKVSDK